MPLQDFNTLDPFSQIYQAVRGFMMADSVLNGIIKTGNFYDVSDPDFFQPKQQSLNVADTPEFIMVQGKFALHPYGTNSKIASFVQNYPLITNYADLSLSVLNKVKYRTMVAFKNAGGDLGLKGLVEKWIITDGEDDPFGKRDLKRDQIRFMAILNIVVTGYIDRNELV